MLTHDTPNYWPLVIRATLALLGIALLCAACAGLWGNLKGKGNDNV